MKSLYKRISALLLAGAISMGGFLSSGVNAYAFSSLINIKRYSIEAISEEEGFEVLAWSSSKNGINESIEMNFNKRKDYQRVKRRLLGKAEEYRSIEEFISKVNKRKIYHQIKIGNNYYVIRFDNFSAEASYNESKSKFMSKKNRYNDSAMKILSKKHKFNILEVVDCSSEPGRVLMNAKIRSDHRYNKVKDKLLKGPEKSYKSVRDFERDKSKPKKGIHRIGIGDLNYIINFR